MRNIYLRIIIISVLVLTIIITVSYFGSNITDRAAITNENNNESIAKEGEDENTIIDEEARAYILDELLNEGIDEGEIDWELTSKLIEINEINWAYVQVYNSNVLININFMSGTAGEKSIEISDEAYELVRDKYTDYNIETKGSI